MINIYRCPCTDPILNFTINFDYLSNFIVNGDWNLWHLMFEPGVKSKNKGKNVVKWIQTLGLLFTGIPGQATYKDGHVINLVFLNIPFTKTFITENFKTRSDFETLLIIIFKRGFSAPERVRYKVLFDCIPEFYGLIKAKA